VGAPTVKKSFTLTEDLVRAADAAVAASGAPNLSAFVQDAIAEKIRREKRSKLHAAYAEAARDPEFMADMREVALEFDRVVGDGLGES
jgi:hypothetical protein